MAKILLEFNIDTKDGVQSLDKIKEALESVGVSGTKVQGAMDAQERSLQKVLNAAEPARVATEKLAAAQQSLQTAVDQGKVSQERAAAALDALKDKYTASQASVTSLSSAFGDLGTKLAGLGTAAGALGVIAGVGEALKSLATAAATAEVSQARLAATWTANAGAAGISKQRLDDLAQSLANVTGYSRDTIKQAEALGLTFHDVTGPTFERLIKDATDMAAVMGTDVTSAVERLGRAMENPTSGLNALTRSGVAFTQQQKEQIKAMADSGDAMGAMSAILDQVEARYKDAAKVIGDTTAGSWDKFKNSITELKQALGSLLMPAAKGGLEGMAGTIKDITTAFNTWTTAIGTFISTLAAGQGPMGAFTLMMQTLAGGTNQQLIVAAPAQTAISAQLDALAAKVAALGAAGVKTFNDDTVAIQMAAEALKKHQALLDEEAKAYAKILEYETKAASLTTLNPSMTLIGFASQASSSMTLGGMNLISGKSSADTFLTDFSSEFRTMSSTTLDPLAQYVGQHFGLAVSQDIIGGIVTAGGGMADAIDPYARDAANRLGKAFSEGLKAVFEGKDLREAWKKLADGLAADAATSFGKMFSALFQGKPIAGAGGALDAAGLWKTTVDPTTGQTSGSFNWAGAASMVGGMITGAAGQDRTMATVGGALSGGVSGGMIGGALSGAASGASSGAAFSWVGAIIGAIIGAAMGYFGSQGPSKLGYNFTAESGDMGTYMGVRNSPQVSGSGFGVDVGYGGPGLATMRNMAQQLADKAAQTTAGLNTLLASMNQNFVNPAWGVIGGIGQKTSDISTAFNTFLNSTLPQTIFAAFQPYIQAGMTAATSYSLVGGQNVATGGLGISSSRAAQELAAVANSSDFTKAMAALQAYVTAVVNLQTLNADLGKTFAQLKATIMENTRAAWQDTMTVTLAQIQRLSHGLEQMTSAEQVTQAQQIYDITEQQYKNNLAYLQQILTLQKTIDQSFSDMFASFDEAKAKGKGTDALALWYEDQLSTLATQLKAAASPEELQQIMSQIQKYGTALWNMNWAGEPTGAGSQASVEDFLKQEQKIADAMLTQWAKDTAAANQQLSDALAEISLALTIQVGAYSQVTAAANDEADARATLVDVINGETSAHGALTDAANTAADAIVAMASAASTAQAIFARAG